MDISDELIQWYEVNKRDLPWRRTRDPYLIWLSEIILQQTRVDQGLKYYEKFASKYPKIKDLANASEQNILRDWQGLGYYSRARNLHSAAQLLVAENGGEFPHTYEDILEMKGVGKYTAAAISSFAYKNPKPVIDGNVQRVLSRLFAIQEPIDSKEGKEKIESVAHEMMPIKNNDIYNQAIMEFGALQCTPVNPKCETCPFTFKCMGYDKNLVEALPIKHKKTKKRTRYFNYLVLRSNHHLALNKRSKNDIWQNMYDFPLIENDKINTWNDIENSELWKEIVGDKVQVVQKGQRSLSHILTHQKIVAKFWEIEMKDMHVPDLQGNIWVSMNELDEYPLPKLIVNYLDIEN